MSRATRCSCHMSQRFVCACVTHSHVAGRPLSHCSAVVSRAAAAGTSPQGDPTVVLSFTCSFLTQSVLCFLLALDPFIFASIPPCRARCSGITRLPAVPLLHPHEHHLTQPFAQRICTGEIRRKASEVRPLPPRAVCRKECALSRFCLQLAACIGRMLVPRTPSPPPSPASSQSGAF